MTPADVRLTGVSHGFNDGPDLFEDLDLHFTAGQVVALCGPSGSGKSTLLSILAGWVRPRRGEVERRNVNRVGWVFQNPHGVPGRTTIDHAVFPLIAAGHPRRHAEDRARAVLDLFGLTPLAARPFRQLSGGEAQRLMLARAVISAPDVLLVDEPTAQLDLRTAETVNATLRHLGDSGSAVVVATHDARTRDSCEFVVDLGDYAPVASGRASERTHL